MTEMKNHVEKRDGAVVECFKENHPFTKVVEILRKKDKDFCVEHVRDKASNEVWMIVVEICLRSSVNCNVWKKNCKRKELSTFVTAYDEAFALLAMENNHEDWIDIVLSDGKREKGRDLTLYNIKNKGKSERSRKGYSLEGKMRFNEILREVIEERKSESSKKKEEWIKGIWMDDDDVLHELPIEMNEEDSRAEKKIEESFTPMNGFIGGVVEL